MKKLIKSILIGVIVAYVLFCLVVVVFPQMFFYEPSPKKANLENAHEYDYLAQEVNYTSVDGTKLYGWYTPPTSKKNIIVFMHGNSYNIESFYYKLKSFVFDGYGTLLVEYRGFGGLDGKINQSNLEADAIASINFLNKLGYKNSEIYLYGMSLGSHMAIHTAYELQKNGEFAGVILEVPFDNIVNVAKTKVSWFPLNILIRDKYDNVEEISQLKSPVLIMGGTEDKKVPVELAKNLYKYAPKNKKMIIYKNGHHSNLFNFRNDLDILNWIEMNEKSI